MSQLNDSIETKADTNDTDTSDETKKKPEFKGLDNLGNTCYMNCVIQALYSIPDFRYNLNINGTKPLHLALKNLFDSMAAKSDQTNVNPCEFWDIFTNYRNQFKDRQQQHDSQEFLRYLINGLHEEVNVAKQQTKTNNGQQLTDKRQRRPKRDKVWNRYLKFVDNSYLVMMFVGQLKSTIKCSHCESERYNWDIYWDLSLSIPETNDDIDINTCLKEYTDVEVLDNDSMPTCETCQSKRKSFKSLSFSRIPPILIIQLKKFVNDGNKISKAVTINSQLVIKSHNYYLFAIICHNGTTCSRGHYTSYCLHNHIWYLFDDEVVHSIQTMDFNTVSSDAYILFYRSVQNHR
ncbi:ubiquitin carboxyl-terminal hydrolase 2-like [Oppia nitens]|uniref:ubiquitin carboxyl-terminal hydrolase 2-like n=1 Tax=Oppia nitens TaxID=1686743 RepID=UPI0023DBC07B|nr:ubiquitin carboxyl-terminal hydrolase 2-like [Oppia nitens]